MGLGGELALSSLMVDRLVLGANGRGFGGCIRMLDLFAVLGK